MTDLVAALHFFFYPFGACTSGSEGSGPQEGFTVLHIFEINWITRHDRLQRLRPYKRSGSWQERYFLIGTLIEETVLTFHWKTTSDYLLRLGFHHITADMEGTVN